ncbi:hypothetical protein MKK50_15720 [Methylobacterium sp. J-043]|jgi:hypothetical protein|uniref:Uncharacterized protein n=1 Tax=Methylobacterium goesingense TaxID=243690 RepID=A0ABV2L880_9HYPH|nr:MULTISPECIES: hypothetical protein [Methylobacteriaceae]KQT49085.1 hypothetical protein ASG52_08890 [Methylobacterium sp. Leaf456]MCJ2030820.1 hypothetical protein [Methylobacterium sp. J-043]UYW33822.1 hypothetical protein OKB92_07005 [Methylorubrum extorquens]GJD74508.1 hypothetical protein CFIICLFH_2742 [Methylobacterium goesingense]
MEPNLAPRVSDAPNSTLVHASGASRQCRGSYRVSPQGAALNSSLMKGLAAVIKDRRLTAPQLRVLLGQLESRDSDLRDELAAIRSHDGDRITWKRLLVFCDAMKVEAGELIASVYLARTAGPRVH